MRGYVRRKFHFSQEDAEDVVMKCFWEACKKEFATPGDIERYMWFLIQKRSFDLLTERKKRAVHECSFADGAEERVQDEGLVDPTDAVSDWLSAAAALALLTSQERAHLALVLSGFGSKESAKELGIDPGNERVRRHRLFQKIEQLSQQHVEAQK
ncbi:hypothetical protein [Streptomyces sp. NPDC002205]|uniref:hypothetical protein n=1 Tax=Streptomyces sp. NPDC002205 TaxID=3154411 RepID=UPI0033285078